MSDSNPLDDELDQFRAEQAKQEAPAKDALYRALRELDRIKASRQELVDAVYRAASDAAAAVSLPPVAQPEQRPESGNAPETAIAVLADWQLGKRTPSYTSQVCAQRIEEYGDKVARLAQLQRADHPVDDLRVYLLGDLVEGELIFPGQAHRIDASLFTQVMADGPTILGGFLRKMLTQFQRVHVVGVIGNHGAIGGPVRRESRPETNADAMMYEATRQRLVGEPRLTWAPTMLNGERLWYQVDRIGEKGFMLFHGDQVKGGALGYPWYGFGKKILGWANGGIPEPFHYALSGHFHTPVRGLYGQIRHWGSGTTESDNTYAAEYFAARGTPSQWLLFAHPRIGVTAEYEIHLGAPEVLGGQLP
jgi:hypothetical protein